MNSRAFSQNVSKAFAVVLLADIRVAVGLFVSRRLRLVRVLLVQPLVFPYQQRPQGQGQECVEEHERRADALSLDVAWSLTFGEYPRAEKRSTLANKVQQHDPESH